MIEALIGKISINVEVKYKFDLNQVIIKLHSIEITFLRIIFAHYFIF